MKGKIIMWVKIPRSESLKEEGRSMLGVKDLKHSYEDPCID